MSTSPQTIANIIKSQITQGVLWSLGAHDFKYSTNTNGTGHPGLVFKARILPFTKTGTRATAPRIMTVFVALNAADLYDITVTYPQRGDTYGFEPPITHEQFDSVDYQSLPAVMLSLDSDDDR